MIQATTFVILTICLLICHSQIVIGNAIDGATMDVPLTVIGDVTYASVQPIYSGRYQMDFGTVKDLKEIDEKKMPLWVDPWKILMRKQPSVV